ncbi:MAG: hypothetical protein WCH34_10720 [Bacteroidota bacterium]
MKTKHILFSVLFMLIFLFAKAQNQLQKEFDAKIKMAYLILEKQPTHQNLKNVLTADFTIDSTNEMCYYIKYLSKTQLVVYLYKDSERTVAVEFYEQNKNKLEIYGYTAKALNYEWIASEHMCDYYKNEQQSIRFCPGMTKGLSVYVEKFE